MSCPEELELFLLDEGSNELDEARAKEVADHLSSCTDCQATIAELRALGDALGKPEPLPENERASFVAEVIRKVDAQDPVATSGPAVSRFWSVGMPITAAVCCGVMAIVVVPILSLTAGSDEAAVAMHSEPSAAAFEMDSEEESNQPFASADRVASRGEGSLASRTPLAQSARSGAPGGGGSPGRGALGAAPVGAASTAAPPPPPAMPAPAMPVDRGGSAGDGSKMLRGGYGQADDLATGAPLQEARARSQARRRPGRPAAKMARRSSGGQLAASPSLGGSRRNQAANGWVQPGGLGLPAERPSAAMAARPASIDSNGRFATTYRPGRGHTARFERTMLQGQVPPPAIELVANEGRGHGPIIAAPTDRALTLDVRSGLGQLPPEGGPVHIALTLRSTAQNPSTRPAVAVHLVMDTSGSMHGAAIEHARQAARRLVTLLQPQDRFSLVSYNSGARVVVQDGPVGPRRARILGQITALVASGGTNLEAGLRQGYAQAQLSRSVQDAVQLTIVLSDGQPNQGITDPWQLSELAAAAFQSGVETTAIGLGDSYEPQVMSTIAEYGAGGYYYLPDGSTMEQVLQTELDVRTHPVARGVELRIRLADGVELLQAYGSRRLNQAEAQRVRATEVAIDHQESHRMGINRDRQQDREGGMRFFIPGFARDDQHTILLRVRAPAGAGSALLANVELRYKDRISNSNQGDERQLRIPYAVDSRSALASSDADVRRAVYSFRTGQALVDVSAQLTTGNHEAALATLYERVEMLRRAAETMNDATLRADAERLDNFRQVIANRTMTNQLMMGSILQRAGNGFMR